MIQRIQTIFMLIAGLSMGLLVWVSDDVEVAMFQPIAGGIMGLILVNIINFKKRTLQILLNNISIVINALLIGLLVYWLLNLPGGIDFPEKGIEPIFPLISIVFLFLANKNINKDERLVKSVDRFR